MNHLLFERTPGRTADLYDPDVADLMRRTGNLLIAGTVAEADYARARVRVLIGKISTDWLKWITRRAGPDITWWAPEVGEQVLVLAPCGNLAQAVVLGAIYQNTYPAPAASADLSLIRWKDGTTVTYDRAAHKLTIDCVGEVDVIAATKITATAPEIDVVAGTKATVTAPEIALAGHVTVKGNVDVTGSITASGSIVDASGNTNHHVHP